MLEKDYFNDTTFNLMVYRLCEAFQLQKAATLLDQMTIQKIPIFNSTYKTVIKHLTDLGMLKEAEVLFNSVPKKTVNIYNVMIHSLAKRRDKKSVESLLASFPGSGVVPNIDTYNHLLSLYSKLKEEDKITSVLEEMEQKQIGWTQKTYEILIRRDLEKQNTDEALRLFEEVETKYPLSPKSLSSKLVLYSRMKLPDFSVSLYNRVKDNKEYLISHVDYHTMLYVHITMNSIQAALGILERMYTSGFPVKNTYLRPLCLFLYKHSMFDHAMHFFEKYKSAGLPPMRDLYMVMVTIFVRKQMAEKSVSLLVNLQESGIFNYKESFLQIYTVFKKFDPRRARVLFEELNQQSVEGSASFLMSLYCYLSLPYQAMLLYSTAKNKIEFDIRVYDSLISLFCRLKLEENAEKVFYDAREQGMVWIKMYNELILLFAELGQISKAASFYHLALRDNIAPDSYTFNNLTSMYLRTDDIQKAKFYFNEMKKTKGVRIDTYSHGIQLTSLALTDSRKAFEYFQMMQKRMIAETYAYNVILNMFAKEKDTERVLKMFWEMKEMKIEDEATYSILISMYGLMGEPEEALRLYEEMKAAGFKQDGVALLALESRGKERRLSQRNIELIE